MSRRGGHGLGAETRVPGRGEVQTGGLGCPLPEESRGFSSGEYSSLWPRLRARVTSEACCKEVELEGGASATFPWHYLQNLLSILLS